MALGDWEIMPVCKAKIYIGLSQQGGRCEVVREYGPHRAEKMVQDILVKRFPFGHTAVRARGSWKCKRAGRERTIIEDSLTIEVADFGNARSCRSFVRKVEVTGRYLAKLFGQDSVMLIVTAPNGQTCGGFVTKDGRRVAASPSCSTIAR